MSQELMSRATEAVSETPVEVNEADFSPEADAARMEKLHEALKGSGPDAEDAPADQEGTEEREPDGKFKAKTEKTEPAKAKAAEPTPGALTEARKLIESGNPEDIDRACQLAFGKSVKDLRFHTRQWDEFRRKFTQSETAAAAKQTAAERTLSEVRSTAQNLLPVALAKAALDAGDAMGFLKHLGSNPDDFQRRLITQMTGQNQSVKDPEAAARLDRLERERAAERAENQRVNSENAQLRTQQAVQRQAETITKELTASGDARFLKVAAKPHFVQKVYDLQCRYFSPPKAGQSHGSTITEIEAAELAWDELYGDVVDATPSRQGRPKPVATETRQGRANPAERGGPRSTANVRQAQAAETAPDDDDSSLDYTDDTARRAHEERLLRRLRTFEQSNA